MTASYEDLQIPVGKQVSQRQLRRLLLDAFNPDELRDLCFDLGVDYDNLPVQSLSKSERVRALIAHMARRQRIRLLAVAVIEYRPHFSLAELLEAIPTAPGPVASPTADSLSPVGEQTMAISQGLTAIVKLLRTPEMNTAVTSFQADFRAASEQIAIMNDYKLLHDLLQQLENRYLLIYNDMQRLPADDLAWDSILLNEPDLRAKIDDLFTATGESAFLDEEARWMNHLQQARQDLQTAVDELELDPLRQAVRRLARVLNRQPSRVNAQLVTAVSGLRLDALVEALDTINARLKEHSGLFYRELSGQIEKAQEALAHLDQRLTRQIRLHNALQEIDDEMRRVDASIAQDTSELEYAWFDLEPMARDLYEAHPEADWAADLARACDRLARSLEAENARKARRFFRSFHSQIRRLFRHVDVELLEMCEELQTVGESLDILRLDLFSRSA